MSATKEPPTSHGEDVLKIKRSDFWALREEIEGAIPFIEENNQVKLKLYNALHTFMLALKK